MVTDLPDYDLPRVVKIDHVELVDLISEITLIKTIENILNIDNIASVDLIDKISTIDEITEIAHITGLDLISGVDTIGQLFQVHFLKHLAHANTTENLIKNGTWTNWYDTDAREWVIQEWICNKVMSVSLGGYGQYGILAEIENGGSATQYLKPNYGDECVFATHLLGLHGGEPLRITLTYSDDTTEVFNFTAVAGTLVFCLCEPTTHKRLKSVTLANIGETYSIYLHNVFGVSMPSVVVSTLPDVIIRDAAASSQKLAVDADGKIGVSTMPDVTQSDETKLKATVTQAAKDRTISSIDTIATPLQINIAALNGNSSALVTPASGKKIRIKFISLEQDAAVDIGYRFGAAGTIYYLRITAGLYVSNLIGCNNEGAADAALYLNSSGATNVKGYILYEEV